MRRAATSVPGIAPDADVAARVGGVLFAVGGLIAFLVVLAPHPPQVNVHRGFIVVGMMAELGGLALYLPRAGFRSARSRSRSRSAPSSSPPASR